MDIKLILMIMMLFVAGLAVVFIFLNKKFVTTTKTDENGNYLAHTNKAMYIFLLITGTTIPLLMFIYTFINFFFNIPYMIITNLACTVSVTAGSILMLSNIVSMSKYKKLNKILTKVSSYSIIVAIVSMILTPIIISIF